MMGMIERLREGCDWHDGDPPVSSAVVIDQDATEKKMTDAADLLEEIRGYIRERSLDYRGCQVDVELSRILEWLDEKLEGK